jgi:hypothetical protein
MKRRTLVKLVLLLSATAGYLWANWEPNPGPQTYELVARVRVEGEEVVLRTGATCEWDSFKGFWAGWDFSIGTRLPSGRGLYMQVTDDICWNNSPGSSTWVARAQEPPVEITDKPPTLYFSDDFGNPTVFNFPYRSPDGGYHVGYADFELVQATWHPLIGTELQQVPTPVIDKEYYWSRGNYASDTLIATAAAGLTYVPVPASDFAVDEAPFARDPSGRYELYRLSSGWRMDFPLRKRATIESLRRARPVLPAGENAVMLGQPGRAIAMAFPSFEGTTYFDLPRVDLIVDGWRVPDGAGANVAVLDTRRKILYLPDPLDVDVVIPQRKAYPR